MSKKEKVIIRDKKKVVYDPLTHHLLMEKYIEEQMSTYMWRFKETPIDLNSIRFKYRKDGLSTATPMPRKLLLRMTWKSSVVWRMRLPGWATLNRSRLVLTTFP